MNERRKYVVFADKGTEEDFEKLKQGKFEEKQLHEFIERAINDLKKNPRCGIWIPKKLIPEHYIQKFSTNNLWKYNLPNAWRLIYTIKGDEVMVISAILEWLDHKSYEKRFGY